MDSDGRASWMWAEACARIEQAERLHRHFFDLLSTPARRPVWEPPVNVFADGAELHLVIALPGAGPEEIAVTLGANAVHVEASVAPPRLGARSNIMRLEIPYGRMRKRVDLPPGRYALRERRLERGCLFLTLIGTSP